MRWTALWIGLVGCDGDGDDGDDDDDAEPTVDLDDDGFAGTDAGGPDCDDADPGIHPDAAEVCDGVDQDCDAAVDEDSLDAVPTWVDSDADGFGGTEHSANLCAPLPSGFSTTGGDCDDADPARHPGSAEVCNGVDDDCDEATVEGFAIGTTLFSSLADAVDAADGGTIDVCDGTYVIAPILVSDAVTIRSLSGARSGVILEGNGDGSLFEVVAGGELTLESVSLDGGSGELIYVDVIEGNVSAGGQIHALDGGAVTVRDCVLENGVAQAGGAIAGVDIVIEDSDLSHHTALLGVGGAIYVNAGGQLTVTNTNLSDNVADYGGAILSLGDVTLTSAELAGNTASTSGGGIYLVNGATIGLAAVAPTLDISTSTFTGNTAQFGGAVYQQGGTAAADDDTEFAANHADVGGGAVTVVCQLETSWSRGTFDGNDALYGGAFFVDATATVDTCALEGITASANVAQDGGALLLYGGPISVSDVVLVDNDGDNGGAVFADTTEATLDGVTVTDNVGVDGGGLYLFVAEVVLANSTIEANAADDGGGAWLDDLSVLSILNTSFGTGATDNEPDDVWVDGTSYATFDLVADLTCSGATELCE